MKIAVDQDSGFEDSEKTDLNLPNQEIPQPIIDPNQLYQLQLQQYHAWMYYQHNEPNYAISQQVYNWKYYGLNKFSTNRPLMPSGHVGWLW